MTTRACRILALLAVLLGLLAPVGLGAEPPPPDKGGEKKEEPAGKKGPDKEGKPAKGKEGKDGKEAPAGPLATGAELPADLVVTPLPPPEKGAKTPAAVKLSTLAGKPRLPLVVLFWSPSCSVSTRYTATFAALAKDFGKKVRFAFVVPDREATAEGIRDALQKAKVTLPATTDHEQKAATALGVKVTPTALLFDAVGVLRYRGPVDDDRRAKNREPVEHLRDALDAVLAKKDVESSEPRPFGSAVRKRD